MIMNKELPKNKEEARQKAIDWQSWSSKARLSYAEISAWQSYFNKVAHMFNLVREFKENAII